MENKIFNRDGKLNRKILKFIPWYYIFCQLFFFTYLCEKTSNYVNTNTKVMNTISVTVRQANHALMLAEWLKNIRFVQKVIIDIDKPASGNAEAVQKTIDSIKSQHLFSDIIDPVAYQRQIRDEWR